MIEFRLSKEGWGDKITNDNSIIHLESNDLEEVKQWLNDNSLEFIRYSVYSQTVYYK